MRRVGTRPRFVSRPPFEDQKHLTSAARRSTAGSSTLDIMASRSGLEALRGIEVETLDLIFQVATAEQWAELLKGSLELAAGQGRRDLAQKLLEAGAQIGDALHAAVRGGHGEVVTDLLGGGAPIDAKSGGGSGQTPLHVAAEQGKPKIVQLLMLKGADKDAMDSIKGTPLYSSVWAGHVTSVLALLAGGADVHIRCGMLKHPVLHRAAREGQVDILKAVIEHGADVNAVDAHQRTALHCATVNNHAVSIDVLVEAGASVDGRDIFSCTPLVMAACTLTLDALAALLKHAALVNNRTPDLRTALHYAATNAGRQGAAEAVDILLRSGADETVLDDNGAAAADVVAEDVEEEDRLAEDVDRVHKLLANAPADRAWRRRGYLVLCRARPDRVQQTPESSRENTEVGRRTHRGDKLARAEALSFKEAVGRGVLDKRAGGEWMDVVARVVGLQEEGIFRTIVGYL